MVRQRQTKTEAKIKAAFTTLVKNKGFDAMTVSDLAREADINRGTFYMHYVDKFDLRDQLLDDVIADLAAILIPESDDDNEPLDVEDIIKSRNLVSAMRYLKRDYAFFDAISGSGNDMQLYERVKDVIKQLLLGQVSRLRKAPDDTPGIPRGIRHGDPRLIHFVHIVVVATPRLPGIAGNHLRHHRTQQIHRPRGHTALKPSVEYLTSPQCTPHNREISGNYAVVPSVGS